MRLSLGRLSYGDLVKLLNTRLLGVRRATETVRKGPQRVFHPLQGLLTDVSQNAFSGQLFDVIAHNRWRDRCAENGQEVRD